MNDSPESLLALWPNYKPTPLHDLTDLAAKLGIGSLIIKNEGERPLGSFKSLGGMYACLRALARQAGISTIAELVATGPHKDLPPLVCASDGNHGLAVAAGAKLAGAPARVYLPAIVPQSRADRILKEGGEVLRIDGTYEDAVQAAAHAARMGEGILIADTTDQPNDPAVTDVMSGYSIMARELRDVLDAGNMAAPTHIFLQAGVGGFAAAIADGLGQHLASPAKIIIVEPESAACVKAALAAGRVVRFAGSLDTSAEMLSCGEASAPALVRLQAHNVEAMTVSEAGLLEAVQMLHAEGGLATTPSGATGFAGLLTAIANDELRTQYALAPASRVLLFATEGPVPA
ncbi:MAG: pyridoxal-phosphate dependent enzyme [Rhizobiaceae bacterium]